MSKSVDLEVLRHSCAHIMAAAVKQLYPEARFGIGPAIEKMAAAEPDYLFDTPGELLQLS